VAATVLQAPKPSIQKPGEQETALVDRFRAQTPALEQRLAPMREQMDTLGSEMSSMAMPAAPDLQQIPQFQARQVDRQEMLNFAGLAMAFSALASKAVRGNVALAMGTAASALEGFQQGNAQQARLDLENFNAQMKSAVEQNRQMLDEYNAVLNNRKITLAQKMQRYNLLANKYQDEIALAALRKGDIRFELERMDKVRDAQNQMEARLAQMQATFQAQLSRIEQQQEPLVPVQEPDGRVVYKPRSQATGGIVPPRNVGDKLTETEAKGTLFWRQMSSAEDAARQIAGPNFDVANLGSQIGMRMAQSDYTNWLAPENAQKYAQAAEQWAEAYLRLKTGAATNQDEIKRNARAYFPQPGDHPATIIQKNQMRAKAIEDVSIIAGRGTEKKPTGGGNTKYTEGQTATGPGGKKLIYRNGNWQPLQ
jgi:hypothetical protein